MRVQCSTERLVFSPQHISLPVREAEAYSSDGHSSHVNGTCHLQLHVLQIILALFFGFEDYYEIKNYKSKVML